MPEKNNKASSRFYRLDSLRNGSRFVIVEDNLFDTIQRAHVRSLSREIDALIYRDNRSLLIEASSHCSRIRDVLSHVEITSFQIVGGPIFDGDIDDTDSLDVSALRAQLKERSKKR